MGKCKAGNRPVRSGFRFYSPSLGRWISRDPIGETGGVHLYAYCNNSPVSACDLLGLETVGSKITRIFVSRLLTPIIDAFRANHYHIYDEENEMGPDLITYTKPALDRAICAQRHMARSHWRMVPLPEKNVAGRGFNLTGDLKGFWLSTSVNVTLEGSVQIRCAPNGNVYYRDVYGIWKWNDAIDANSFPGIAWLKGEGKTVFQNEAPWAVAVIEGLWDIIGDSIFDTDFLVTVEWLERSQDERLARCGEP